MLKRLTHPEKMRILLTTTPGVVSDHVFYFYGINAPNTIAARLRAEGLDIERGTRMGYRLRRTTDG